MQCCVKVLGESAFEARDCCTNWTVQLKFRKICRNRGQFAFQGTDTALDLLLFSVFVTITCNYPKSFF